MGFKIKNTYLMCQTTSDPGEISVSTFDTPIVSPTPIKSFSMQALLF